jgi:hypothetical protein
MLRPWIAFAFALAVAVACGGQESETKAPAPAAGAGSTPPPAAAVKAPAEAPVDPLAKECLDTVAAERFREALSICVRAAQADPDNSAVAQALRTAREKVANAAVAPPPAAPDLEDTVLDDDEGPRD